jgi:hypothetical protein
MTETTDQNAMQAGTTTHEPSGDQTAPDASPAAGAPQGGEPIDQYPLPLGATGDVQGTEGQPEGEDAEGAPAAEGEGTEGAEGEGETPWVVTLPGLPERGEEPIELEAPDEETYNRLNRLANEAAIGRQVREERRALQAQRQELAQVEDMIALDPTGFILSRIPESVRTDVAMQLLFQPEVLAAIEKRLQENDAVKEFLGEGDVSLTAVLNDRLALRTLRAELEADRLRMQAKLREQLEQRRAVQAAAERIAAEVDRLIPPDITGERREQLFQDAIRDVRERLERLQVNEVDPHDVRLIVSERFRRLGIQPARIENGGPEGGQAPGRAAASPSRTGQQFVQARNAKRAAAATAPAGAGAPAARPRPDLPKGTDARIKLAREKGLAALLGLR